MSDLFGPARGTRQTPLPDRCHWCLGSGRGYHWSKPSSVNSGEGWGAPPACSACAGSGVVVNRMTIPEPSSELDLYARESDLVFMRRMQAKMSAAGEVAMVDALRVKSDDLVGALVPLTHPGLQHRARAGSAVSSAVESMMQKFPNFLGEVERIGVTRRLLYEFLHDLGAPTHSEDTIRVEVPSTGDTIVIYSAEDFDK